MDVKETAANILFRVVNNMSVSFQNIQENTHMTSPTWSYTHNKFMNVCKGTKCVCVRVRVCVCACACARACVGPGTARPKGRARPFGNEWYDMFRELVFEIWN